MPEKSGNTEPDSPQNLAKLIDELRSDRDWRRQQALNTRHHALYHEEHSVEVLEDTQGMIVDPAKNIIRLGRARELVDHMTGLKLVHPQYSVTALGYGSPPEERSDKIEKWANAILPLIEWEQGQDTNDAVTQEIDLFGYSGVEVFPYPAAWQDKQPRSEDYSEEEYASARKKFTRTAPIPIAVWHIPAQSWYPQRDGRNVIRSISIDKCTVGYARNRYGNRKELDDKNETDEIEIVSFLDRKIRSFHLFMNTEIMDDPLEIWEHHNPVELAPCVLYEGLTTSDKRPGYRWTSLLQPIYDSLVTLDFLMSRKRLMVATYYLPTILRYLDPETGLNPTNQQSKRKLKLGNVNTFSSGEKLEGWQPPTELAVAETMARELIERVERTVPSVLQGVLDDRTPGYTFNQAAEYALRRHQPVVQRTARSDVEVMRLVFKALWAWEQISGETEVWIRRESDEGSERLGLGWKDVKDYEPLLHAERKRTLPVDQLANLQAANEAVTGPLQLPRGWAAREFVSIENYNELWLQRLAEDMQRAPPLLNRTQDEIFRKLQVKIDEGESYSPEQVLAMDGVPPGLKEMAEGMVNQNQIPAGNVAPPVTMARAGQRSQPSGVNAETGDVGIQG